MLKISSPRLICYNPLKFSMKYFAVLFVNLLVIILSQTEAFAEDTEAYNPNSVHPVPYSNILMKKRIWRHIDLKEKYNKPFFPHSKEITKYIIEGVKAGRLVPYLDEKFAEPMTQEAFFEKLRLPDFDEFSEEEKTIGLTEEEWSSDASKKIHKEETIDYFLPNEVSILEIAEDWIFDKVRSVQVYDIQSIKLIIPANKFETGLRKEVGIFKYKDLAAYFDEQEIPWVNVNNSAGNVLLTEAFELRLFSSKIIKLENPDDSTIASIYDNSPKGAAIASKELEEKLLEEEYFLWAP